MSLLRYHATKDWEKTDNLFNSWLEERTILLKRYYDVADLKLFPEETTSISQKERHTIFIESLVDYITTGHFEIFIKIQEVLKAAKDIMPKKEQSAKLINTLLLSTELILDRTNTDVTDDPEYKENLSIIGELITERMDIEDKLLEYYLYASGSLHKKNKRQSGNAA